MEVLTFNENNFAKALSNNYTSEDVIRSKNHFAYLFKYLKDKSINVTTILIEEDYISKDFLHDYTSYYALCFEKYPKFCNRIHFFSSAFTREEFEDFLIDQKAGDKTIWRSYLGFIVVKPIPVTVIGYSLLKPFKFKSTFGSRNLWGLKEYKIHLCGYEHKMKSLVFQEQDSVVAACATTAIWIMLNKASIDFNIILKSPSEITKDADNVAPDGSRLFPNKGLNLTQICQAFLLSGLVSEVKPPDFYIYDNNGKLNREVVSTLYLKKILNAYSPLGIPIILILLVPNQDSFGLHAVTVSGFRQDPPRDIQPTDEISLLAENIVSVYAHDDQFGPFVKIEFFDEYNIQTPWTEIDSIHRSTTIEWIIVPLYPKVRISYEEIEKIVLGLDVILTLSFRHINILDLVWDIKIDYSEKFKARILQSSLSRREKLQLISKSMPRFIWIGTCYTSGHKIIEVTFDATDVEAGMIAEDIVFYMSNEIRKFLISFLTRNRLILQDSFNHQEAAAYYDFVLEELTGNKN